MNLDKEEILTRIILINIKPSDKFFETKKKINENKNLSGKVLEKSKKRIKNI
jgi:hypothetical protein